jgi:hypothetical protein
MTHIKGTTRAQTVFLRAFVKHPCGPPVEEWPSPVILRRWLKRPGFCGAMNSILRALRYQADFHLAAAAASGAHALHGTVRSADADGKVDVDLANLRKKIDGLTQLLRMAHIRHRFADPLPEPPQRTPNDWIIQWFRIVHPNNTVEEALRAFDVMSAGQREPGARGPAYHVWKRTGHPFSPKWQERSPWERPRPHADADVDPARADAGDAEGDDDGSDDDFDYDDDGNVEGGENDGDRRH